MQVSNTVRVSEEVIRAAIAECRAAMCALDVDRVLACFAEEAEVVSPDGRYAGREQVGAYVRWLYSRLSSRTVREAGAGVQVFGNTAIEEIVESIVTKDGVHLEIPVLVVNDFDEHAKLRRRAFYNDRWPMIRDIVSASGGLAGAIGRSFVSRIESGFTEGRPTPA